MSRGTFAPNAACVAVLAAEVLGALPVALRRRAGHEQAQRAITRVVVISATLGLLGFFVWYYLLSEAFIISFLPSR